MEFQLIFREISKDTPDWCQTYSRFYTEENLEKARKLGRRKQIKISDIFGNKQTESKGKKINFSLVPPPIIALYVSHFIIKLKKKKLLRKNQEWE